MTSYLSNALRERTPQSESIREDQVENSAGGFVWQGDPLMRLRRFLILGTEGGTYYASERKASRVQLENIRRIVADPELGRAAVAMVVEVSEDGLAQKNDPALLVLAMATVLGDLETRRAAYRALPAVARIGTHLFHFCQFREDLGGGWGRGVARAVGNWYAAQSSESLAYQLVKYRQRDGWTHRDVMRLSHPEASSNAHKALYDFACGRTPEVLGDLPRIVKGYMGAQGATSATRSAELVREFRLPREAVNTDHLDEPKVQEALLERMPLTAMVRNLGNMSKSGMLVPGSDAEMTVCNRVLDGDAIQKARLHPIGILAALVTYASGRGARGRGAWIPCPRVVDALNDAFYLSFKTVERSGVRTLLALDISGSMHGHDINGIPGLDARTASAAMALVTAATEPKYEVVAFSDSGPEAWVVPSQRYYLKMGITPLPLSPRQRLDDVLGLIDHYHMGGTDCSLPMLWAKEKGRKFDHMVVYTDNETWAGDIHPAEALKDYRRSSGIDTKLTVVGMCANDFTIADPTDEGMMDVVGFSADSPQLISAFASGKL